MSGIAVIIVNYGTADLALDGVASVLERDHGGRAVEVHLVDNASPNGDGAKIAAEIAARGWQDRLSFYPETENHGFGRGNNVVLHRLAARADPPDYVFLLNPDAALQNETLAVMADFLDAHQDVAMAGARAENPGDPAPVTAAFRFPGLASTFAAAISFGPVSRFFRHHEVALGPDIASGPVDWVSGASVMARFAVWRDLGFFDPEYFLYYEEVDLMLRTQRAGWGCWYLTEARIVHIEGASTEVRSAETARRRRPAYLYHSWQYYFSHNHGRAYALATAGAWMLGAALNYGLSVLRRKTPAAPLHFFGDFWAYSLRPLLGMTPKGAVKAVAERDN